jgi:hypothetical protein
MKPTSTPHDPLDELLAAAVHGELTAAQRAELDALLQNDPAARAAYQEIQTMHDLLERNHHEAKPDPAFEDRMISGVRRKARADKRETPWESALLLWSALKWPFRRSVVWPTVAFCAIMMILAGVALGPITNGIRSSKESQLVMERRQKELDAEAKAGYQAGGTVADANSTVTTSTTQLPMGLPATTNALRSRLDSVNAPQGLTLSQMQPRKEQSQQGFTSAPSALAADAPSDPGAMTPVPALPPPDGTQASASSLSAPRAQPVSDADETKMAPSGSALAANAPAPMAAPAAPTAPSAAVDQNQAVTASTAPAPQMEAVMTDASAAPASRTDSGAIKDVAKSTAEPAANKPAAPDTRKLIRDAQLDLEVKSYQKTVDAITELGRGAGGYLDSSNSQRGGNGKLQGTVVVKVLPENLDSVLLKLRELGEVKNQSVSTQDVTKDYYDTQARLDNSQRMEAQLQLLLAHTNGKVSDLLQVERELERVRGDIEQMQGQLKLYDFQVQYATITITVAEKDLNKAAAYLLQENDQFALFVHDVEDAFTQAKTAADTFKAQILNANLQHDSGNSMSATLAFSVPPDQIDGFLAQVKSLGRVDNFTRTTQRVANDGGDPDQPADETRTEKAAVQVQLTIRADDESPRQQTQLAIASTGDIDAQAQQLKDDAVKAGASVTASNFQRAPDGTETATISFRIALSKVGDLMPTVEKLGRVETLTVQRNDRPDQTAADPSAPAEIDLTLHNVAAVSFENEQPRQATQLAISSTGDVDAQAQQVKSDALQAGMAVTASTFERQPDGTEQAALTFRLPMTKAADFTATLEKLGKVESLAVQRNDVTGPNSTDPNAPAEISLTLHNEPAVVADDRGFWPTVRHTFGGGIEAFLTSVQTIGVLVAFILPWVVALAVVAWTARRIYVARRARA